MKSLKLLLLFFFCVSLSGGELKLKIVGNDWGNANKVDLLKVLNSAANAIWKHCPDIELPPIQVGNSTDSPISLFKRAENGDLKVKLTSKNLFWSQHAYQFAHELGHCLCRFKKADKANMWFEESVCEAASLFTLRAMAKEWAVKPPYPHWKDYSKSLFAYAEKLLKDPQRNLPKGKTVASWFAENREYLEKNSTDRVKNAIVAKKLLFLLENEPTQWQAFFWINEKRGDKRVSLEEYLENWHKSVAPKHKSFVLKVIKLFKDDSDE